MAENKKRMMHKILITRVLEGPGKASHLQRRAAFDNQRLDEPLRTLINEVANHAYKVTDEDIRVVREAGFNEDQIFELVVCAAIGQSTRQYENALETLYTITEVNDRAT